MKKFSWLAAFLLLAACDGTPKDIHGSSDYTDTFTVPLDTSGPTDEIIIDRMEETERRSD